MSVNAVNFKSSMGCSPLRNDNHVSFARKQYSEETKTENKKSHTGAYIATGIGLAAAIAAGFPPAASVSAGFLPAAVTAASTVTATVAGSGAAAAAIAGGATPRRRTCRAGRRGG